MLGVYEKSLLVPVAEASKMLGSKRVMVVCSRDGFDEISPCAPTDVVEIDEDGIRKEYVILPESLGVPDCAVDDLAGGDAVRNAGLAMELVNGLGRPAILAAVALNAGAALYIAMRAKTIQEGYRLALHALEDGSVLRKIEEVRAASCA